MCKSSHQPRIRQAKAPERIILMCQQMSIKRLPKIRDKEDIQTHENKFLNLILGIQQQCVCHGGKQKFIAEQTDKISLKESLPELVHCF